MTTAKSSIYPTRLVILGLVVLLVCVVGNTFAMRTAAWNFQASEFDMLQVLPTAYWVFLVVGTFAGVLALWGAKNTGTMMACIVGITLLYGPSFLVGLYPGIAGWDTYLHATPAETLLTEGVIHTNHLYSSQYPGPAIILALFAHVTNLSPIIAGLILINIIQLTLSLTFMALAQFFLSAKESAWTSLAILILTPAILTNDHYSQWAIAYLESWAVVLLLIYNSRQTPKEWRKISIIVYVLVAVIITSHPIVPVVLIGMVGGIIVWSVLYSRAMVRVRGLFTTIIVIMLVSWIIYVATSYFETGLLTLESFLTDTRESVESWAVLTLSDVFAIASPLSVTLILLRWLAYVGVGLIAGLGLLLLKQYRKQMLLLFILVLSCGAVVMMSFASAAPWIQRLFYFVPPLLTIGAALVIFRGDQILRLSPAIVKWGNRVAVLGIIPGALLLSLLLWHPPTLLYSIHPSEAPFVIWPQESHALAYASAQAEDDELIGSDLQTLIVFMYLKPDYYASTYSIGVSMGSDLEGQKQADNLLFEGDWIVRSQRQEMMSYQAQNTSPQFWKDLDFTLDQFADRVYDNGFSSVYRRRD